MPASSKGAMPFHYLVLGGWLMLVVLAAVYFIRLRLVSFDPDQMLKGIESDLFISEIKRLAGLDNEKLSNTVIHFTAPNCHCTQFGEAHKKAINTSAMSQGFNIVNVQLDPTDLNTIIPSTPAVLLVDKLGQLLYFGPYSQGLACSQSNGFIETALNNYKIGLSAKLILSETQGCYCNT
ncbi:MAG: hypothetical protein HRU23_00270 [Gammaproteobacteria bacterium]|nr:hypothetical protein [Gammaproteobacteria bacterium]